MIHHGVAPSTAIFRRAPLLAAGFLAALLAGCGDAASDANLAVVEPRPGRVLKAAPDAKDGVAIVYSYREDINLKLGWEKFHDFDLHKGRKVFDRLVADGAIAPEDVFVPAPADDDMLARIHSRDYIASLDDRSVAAAIMNSNIPKWQSQQEHVERIVGAYRTAVGGTVAAAEQAMIHGQAVHLGGGFKHALPDRGARSCLLADVAVAVDLLLERGLVERVMIIDTGALQANGLVVALAEAEHVHLLDVYEKNNYPQAKQIEPGGVPIDDGMGDGEYLALLRNALSKSLDDFRPQIVFYLGGVDVARGDTVGRTNLSAAGIVTRDRAVIKAVRDRGAPLCMVLSSGWENDSWKLHYRTIRWALSAYGGVPFRPTMESP